MFDFLETNDTLFKVLGMALAVGNIMNGGTTKGQSDGFEVVVITKIASTKDNNNKSMMSFIMQHLVAADEELPARYREQFKVFNTRNTDMDSLAKKYADTNMAYHEAAACHKAITESGEDPDNFSNQLGAELKMVKTDLEEFDREIKAMKERFEKLCDFFQLDIKDDKRKSTADFFIFYKKFLKEIEDGLPKEEKKRAGGKRTTTTALPAGKPMGGVNPA